MTPTLESSLIKKYPKIFGDSSKQPDESPMFFGIECDDGWYHIIDSLCSSLSNPYEQWIGIMGKNEYFFCPPPEVVAVQVKEKYGALNFYYYLNFADVFQNIVKDHPDDQGVKLWQNGYFNYFDGMIKMAEVLSIKTCEICGERGELHSKGGWLKTLCPKHAEEMGYNNFEISNDKDCNFL